VTTFEQGAGFALLAVGVGLMAVAMTFCTTPLGRRCLIWLRGSIPRDHFTKLGLRLYLTGIALFLLGLFTIVLTAR